MPAATRGSSQFTYATNLALPGGDLIQVNALYQHFTTIKLILPAVHMKPLSATHYKRNFAIALLLLWVFAIANACVLDPLSIDVQFTTGDPSIISAGNATFISAAKFDYFIGSASDGTWSAGSGGPCLEASDFGPLSAIGIQSNAGFEHLNVLPPAVTRLTVATPIDLVQRPIDEQRSLETAIPLRVRYRRLPSLRRGLRPHYPQLISIPLDSVLGYRAQTLIRSSNRCCAPNHSRPERHRRNVFSNSTRPSIFKGIYQQRWSSEHVAPYSYGS